MKFNTYCIVLVDPVSRARKTVAYVASDARTAAIEAVDEYGPEGFYVVKSVTML